MIRISKASGLNFEGSHGCHMWKTVSVSVSTALSRRRPSRRPFMTNSKKKRPGIPDETHLSLPPHAPSVDYTIPIVDTHTHLLSTYQRYRSVYSNPRYEDVFSFVREMYGASKEEKVGISRHGTDAIIDVWCEAPVTRAWKEIADSSLSETERKERWGGVEYWFVMGEWFVTRSCAKLM